MYRKAIRIGMNFLGLGVFYIVAAGGLTGHFWTMAAAYADPLSLGLTSSTASTIVPEPSSLALMITGVAILSYVVARARRRRDRDV